MPILQSLLSSPYTVNSPLPGAPQLDPNTGEITYDANTAGFFVTCVKVQAYKCGQLVAEVYREVQVVLIACPTMPGTGALNNLRILINHLLIL